MFPKLREPAMAMIEATTAKAPPADVATTKIGLFKQYASAPPINPNTTTHITAFPF
jgi:hypothetical protein